MTNRAFGFREQPDSDVRLDQFSKELVTYGTPDRSRISLSHSASTSAISAPCSMPARVGKSANSAGAP
jgi:hypothetical protein